MEMPAGPQDSMRCLEMLLGWSAARHGLLQTTLTKRCRERRVVAARYDFFRAAYCVGYKPSSIANFVGCDPTTVFYALNLLANRKTMLNPPQIAGALFRKWGPTMKKCTRCQVDKPFTEFTRSLKSKDGLRHACRACISLQNAAYRDRQRMRAGREPIERRPDYLPNEERNIDYAANQRRWAEKAMGVDYGGR